MNSLILVLMACLVLAHTLANPHDSGVEARNSNISDDISDSGSNDDDSGENGSKDDDNGSNDDDSGKNGSNDENSKTGKNKDYSEFEQDRQKFNDKIDVCRQAIKARCEQFHVSKDECTTCAELFDDQAACINLDYCIFDTETGVCSLKV
ncbi:dentin sialophosphoprotein [Magallana gigas]|uniref:dentin sialophosphoprotein n=1 Tax=Magallana gigas TaxID=29159 RepID=UPI0005C3C60E|eukprot:XP_011433986.1 PREDICTED: variant-silencing SET domain-containing protein-like [Crassostrea gigas]